MSQVADSGGQTVLVDGQSVEEIVAEVEALFADALARGPTATTVHERRALLRYANQAIVSQHLAYFARPWSTEDSRRAVRSFACECGQLDCLEQVDIAIADFPGTPLLAAH